MQVDVLTVSDVHCSVERQVVVAAVTTRDFSLGADGLWCFTVNGFRVGCSSKHVVLPALDQQLETCLFVGSELLPQIAADWGLQEANALAIVELQWLHGLLAANGVRHDDLMVSAVFQTGVAPPLNM